VRARRASERRVTRERQFFTSPHRNLPLVVASSPRIDRPHFVDARRRARRDAVQPARDGRAQRPEVALPARAADAERAERAAARERGEHRGPATRGAAESASDGVRLPRRRRGRRDHAATEQGRVQLPGAPPSSPRRPQAAARSERAVHALGVRAPVLRVADGGKQDVPRRRRAGRRASRGEARRDVLPLHHGHVRARGGRGRDPAEAPEALPAVRLERPRARPRHAQAGDGQRVRRARAHRRPDVVRQPRARRAQRLHGPARVHAQTDRGRGPRARVELGLSRERGVRVRGGETRRRRRVLYTGPHTTAFAW